MCNHTNIKKVKVYTYDKGSSVKTKCNKRPRRAITTTISYSSYVTVLFKYFHTNMYVTCMKMLKQYRSINTALRDDGTAPEVLEW